MSPIYPQFVAMARDTTIIVALLIAVWRLAFASGKITEAQKSNAEALKDSARAALAIAESVKDFVAAQQRINERQQEMNDLLRHSVAVLGGRMTNIEGKA